MVKIIAECIYTHDDDRYDNKTRAQQKCLKEEIMSPEYQVTKLMEAPPKDLQVAPFQVLKSQFWKLKELSCNKESWR